ncbi:MAG TPA: hypothetical protein VFA45_10960 [Actinomycetes bacterium]|jgi:hypothetical protein|nr:hypothetical protein [Actinomycetes bacterium]
MRKLIIGGAAFAAVLAAARRFGPALGERAMRKCEQMFDRMPEDFPPKRMLHGIEEIRAQNTQILHQLEQEEHRRTAVAAGV